MTCISIVSCIGLSPVQHQAITWTRSGDLLSVGTLGTTFGEIWIAILSFSLRKMHLKMSSAKWQPFSNSVYRSSLIFIEENAFEDIICEMVAILSRGDEFMKFGIWSINRCCLTIIGIPIEAIWSLQWDFQSDNMTSLYCIRSLVIFWHISWYWCVFVLLGFCLFSIIYAAICMFCWLHILLWAWGWQQQYVNVKLSPSVSG